MIKFIDCVVYQGTKKNSNRCTWSKQNYKRSEDIQFVFTLCTFFLKRLIVANIFVN